MVGDKRWEEDDKLALGEINLIQKHKWYVNSKTLEILKTKAVIWAIQLTHIFRLLSTQPNAKHVTYVNSFDP